MKRVLLVFGTRPEAIKMAPVVQELQKHPDQFKVQVCVTAQHRQMLDQVLDLFEIVPDYDLDIMKPGQSLTDVTCNVLQGLTPVLEGSRPDVVLVHGDTTTTMAASLAAFYQKIAVGHVESGLRTGNIYSPWPEEMNRRLTSAITRYHFAPTEQSRQNLLAEGVAYKNIVVTGNTVIDALMLVREKLTAGNLGERIRQDLVSRYSDLASLFPNIGSLDNIGRLPLAAGSLDNNGRLSLAAGSLYNNSSVQLPDASGNLQVTSGQLPAASRRLILVTGHRREDFGEGFENICHALKEITETQGDVEIIYPVHLNPNVQEP